MSFRALLFLVIFISSSSSWALSEFRGMMREAQTLRSGPGEDYAQSSSVVQSEEEVYVLGTSVRGGWAQVLRRNGDIGWVSSGHMDFFRMSLSEYDDFYKILQIERRTTHRWAFNAGVSIGPKPLGIGAEGMSFYNFFPAGLVTNKGDQLEIGTGFGYFRGSALTPLWTSATTIENEEAHPLYMIPFAAQWLLRMGPRGNLLAGPRIGSAWVRDNYLNLDFNMPLQGGLALRYYADEHVGLYANAMTMIKGATYYYVNFGASLRY